MRLAALLGFLATTNVLLGFLYQWYIIAALGAGLETDALFAAMVVPQLITAVISNSLMHVLVPLLACQEGDRFADDAWVFFQGIGLCFGVMASILFVVADTWIPWIVPGFEEPATSLTVSLVQIHLVGMVFTALTTVLWSIYYARKQFVWVQLSGILSNIVSFGFLVWALARFGVLGAAWAALLRAVLQTLFLIKILGMYRRSTWRSDATREAWRRLRPLLLGTTFYKTDQLVDRILASMAPAGELSLLYLAHQIYGTGNTILNKAVTTPLVSVLAKKAGHNQWQSYRSVVNKRLFVMLVVTCLSFVVILLAGEQIIALVFGHGRFDSEDIVTLWLLLIALVGVWIGGATGQVLSTSFYSQGDTVTPVKIGVAGFTLGLAFKIIGFHFEGVIGIAIGTSLYYFLNAIVLQFFLMKGLRRQLST